MLPRLSPLLVLALAACTESHATHVDAPAPDVPRLADAGPPQPDTPAAPDAPSLRTPLATCFAGGGELVEVATVDNSDTAEHGALLGLAVTREGLVAAAAEDGTLKLWTLDAELAFAFDGAILTYGPEIPAAPITDLAIDGADVIAGDVRGVVLRMSREDGLFPVGGTTPEIAIRAVAWDEASGRLAHAQSGDVVPLTLRDESGVRELATAIDVFDLAFEADGSLLVAGARDGRAVIERRSPGAPDVPSDARATELAGPFLEIATSRLGPVGVTREAIVLAPFTVARTGLRSVAVAESDAGSFAVVAGEAGVEVFDVAGGHAPAGLPLGDAVTVRVDATGTLAIVGTRDALIHVFACE